MCNMQKFSGPLKPELMKKYDEQFALLVLQHCYRAEYDDYVLLDAPDLQSNDEKIGIEVTKAIFPRDAQIYGEFNRYRLGEKSENNRSRCKRLIEKNGGAIDEYSITFPAKTSDDERIIVQNAIRRKTEKIRDYRSKGFQRLGLFVLYEEPIIPVRSDTLATWFDTVQDDCNDRYDFLFFCYSCGIIYCDYWLQKFEISPIDPSRYDKIAFQARVYVERTQNQMKSQGE